jgi:hypothetical protein
VDQWDARMEALFSAKFDGVDRGPGRATTALPQVQKSFAEAHF